MNKQETAETLEEAYKRLGIGAENTATRIRELADKLKAWNEETRRALGRKGYISRNDPCYCGSAIKYKKCCINKR